MTLSTQEPASPAPGIRHHENLALLTACACTILVVGFVAAINLAVPLLGASALHPTSAQLLWIVDVYVVVFACLVIPGGAVGDRFGRKGTLIAGLLVFAAGTVAAALATTVPLMLAGRVVSGVGAALVLPNCVGVLIHATAPPRRRRAVALWGGLSGMGGIIGNTAGAALLNTGSWQTLFWSVAPVAVICAVFVSVTVRPSPHVFRRLDPIGTLLLVATAVALLGGIIQTSDRGWGSPPVLAAFAVALALGTVWVVFELRVKHPLLNPRLFRSPLLRGAALGMMVTWFGSFGLFYLNASLLQYGRGWSVLMTGFATLPLAIPIVALGAAVPAIVARIGVPTTLGSAFVLISAGLLGLSFATAQPFVVYALWLIVVGLGFALALPTLTSELTASLPAEQAGVAGGLQSFTRELGSALGIAVTGTITVAVFSRHLPAALQALDPVPRTIVEASAHSPGSSQQIIAAFVAGADTALQVGAAVTLLVGILVVALVTRRAHRSR